MAKRKVSKSTRKAEKGLKRREKAVKKVVSQKRTNIFGSPVQSIGLGASHGGDLLSPTGRRTRKSFVHAVRVLGKPGSLRSRQEELVRTASSLTKQQRKALDKRKGREQFGIGKTIASLHKFRSKKRK